MNSHQLAVFLASCTTSGFRRSLKQNPQHTLLRCGFSFPEAAALAAALVALNANKHSRSGSPHNTREFENFQFVFQTISWTAKGGNATDDWDS
jgi:hypothetical protein